MQGWTIWETLANTIDGRRPHALPRPRRGPPRLQRQDHGGQADDRAPPRQRHEGASADPDRVGHLRDDRALREGDEGGGGDQEPPRAAARARRPGPRAGVRPRQGHPRPRHPGRGRQLRLRPRAPRGAQAEGLDASGGPRTRDRRGWLETVQPLLVLQTPNTPNPDDVGIALDTIFDGVPGADSRRRCATCSATTATQKFGAWDGRLDRAAARSGRRRTCACWSRRTRSRLAGTARAPRCWCRSARRRTTPTSPSCSAAWCAARSPGASPATSG